MNFVYAVGVMLPALSPDELNPLTERCVLLLALEPATDETQVRVRCRGEIDMSTAGQLEREVRGVAARGATAVTLDLRHIEFMDCTGLTALLGLDREAREDGWRFELVYADGPVERLLDLTETAGRFARAL
jgi:anti-anti-sigma factor